MPKGVEYTIQYFLPRAIIFWVLFRGIMLLAKIILKKHIFLKREIVLNILTLSIFIIVGLTVFPIQIIWEKPNIPADLKPSVNIIPLKDIYYQIINVGILTTSKHLIGNIFLLAPLGVCLPLLSNRFKKIMPNIVLGFSLSILIEILQYVKAYLTPLPSAKFSRATDINDVILNTIGIIIAYFVYKSLFSNIELESKIFSKNTDV
jgi:glycopeptide antibiotics resistance protein